jgi:hypothetical protein
MQRVMDAFMPKYVGSGRPLGMAVFHSVDPTNQTTTLFFSPDAASLAMQFGASGFEGAFNDIELSLMVGDPACVEYLFPDLGTQP